MRPSGYIFAALTAVFLLASCGEKDRVIPRSRLAEIYAEMLMTDQWIISNSGNRHAADTSLVYEPILEKYGYTSADYRKSVDAYMDDPERFSRILRTTSELLDKRLVKLQEIKDEMDRQEALKKLRESMKIKVEIDMGEFFPYLDEEPYVHYYDSLSVEPDSALMVYRMKNIVRSDTLYEGLRMVVRDTLAVTDTLAVKDTLKTEHTWE